MTWKKVNQSDAGTASKFGGNDLDKVSDAFNGADVTDPIKYNTDINTLYASTNAAGDILKSNGTKYVRLARGTANQVLRVNTGGTDLAYASLDSERVGKSTASGNGSTTVFNIAHGLGSNPTYTFVNCSSILTTFTYVTDATNIVVTFASAPASGSNNVVMYWRVVA